MRPEFGNKEHIKLRDKIDKEIVWNVLKLKLKCPHCGAKPMNCFEFDEKEKTIGINFWCEDGCKNSLEAESAEPDVYFTFNGKAI